MKKGFTLVELLAVIVILAVILVIAIPQVLKAVDNSRTKAYIKNEQMVANVAKTYLASNSGKAPSEIGETLFIDLGDLQEENLIGQIIDVRNKHTMCTGYVAITKIDINDYDYQTFINCGDNYQTEGYENLIIIDVLVVAGGGGGGRHVAGGGGSGGLIYKTNVPVRFVNPVSIYVGNGGNGADRTGTGGIPSSRGEDSIFGDLIAIGGGRGAAYNTSGGEGGSGGGAGSTGSSAAPDGVLLGGDSVIGQGHKGGGADFLSTGTNHGAGGGGAGASGGYGKLGYQEGGAGLYFGDLFTEEYGDSGWFAGGGGGGRRGQNPSVPGGIGGGGNGGGGESGGIGVDAMINTGGGGGGGGFILIDEEWIDAGGAGGSGIILIRYPGPQRANGGIVSTFNGYTIHAFTEVGESIFEVLEF